jgi:hypothetical protein
MEFPDFISKPLIKTKTFWGVMIAMLPDVLNGIHQVAVQAPVLAEQVNNIANSGFVPPKLVVALHVIGGGLALVGRYAAKVKVEGVFKQQ